MAGHSRRAVLRGAAVFTAASFTERWPAVAAGPPTRYSAFSTEGKKSLASYAKAVDAMVKRSKQDPTDPLGWLYQYKMHEFPDNGNDILFGNGTQGPALLKKAQEAELDHYFGPAGSSNVKRVQAEATWGKCPHSIFGFAADFFPWHRKYLFFFERIVRKLSGDDNFTLPYWGYMDGASSQIIPPEFMSPTSNPLFHDRAPAINQGGAIDPSAFRGQFWSDLAFQPFSFAVEGTPHGNVHDDVGYPNYDMSDIFRSPRDTVFWIHHSEIDRIWEGGIKAGVQAPGGSWLIQKHQFFDENGVFVELTNNDVLDTQAIKNWPGYVYHELPQPPAAQVAFSLSQTGQTPVRRTLATAASVTLRTGLQTTGLTPLASLTAAAPADGRSRKLTLEVSDVTLTRRSVANVGLYLNPPTNATSEQLRKYLVGSLPTFSLPPEGVKMDHADHVAGPPPTYSFDVTRIVTDLRDQGLWTDELKLVTKEITGSLGDAAIKLGKVELIETSATGTRQ
jgi:tyrosinase